MRQVVMMRAYTTGGFKDQTIPDPEKIASRQYPKHYDYISGHNALSRSAISCGRHPSVQTLGVYSDLPMPTKSPPCLLPACGLEAKDAVDFGQAVEVP